MFELAHKLGLWVITIRLILPESGCKRLKVFLGWQFLRFLKLSLLPSQEMLHHFELVLGHLKFLFGCL